MREGMNSQVKKQWIDALLSDKYGQTKGKLRDGEGYCCLGVLCELAVAAGVIEQPVADAAGVYSYGEAGIQEMPPTAVIKWAGLPNDDGDPDVDVDDEDVDTGEPYKRQTTLASLNDEGKSFTEIAALIKEQL